MIWFLNNTFLHLIWFNFSWDWCISFIPGSNISMHKRIKIKTDSNNHFGSLQLSLSRLLVRLSCVYVRMLLSHETTSNDTVSSFYTIYMITISYSSIVPPKELKNLKYDLRKEWESCISQTFFVSYVLKTYEKIACYILLTVLLFMLDFQRKYGMKMVFRIS